MTAVVIIGAGIVGAALADQLSRAGAAVTVVDSEQPGTGTSGSSLGWINANEKLPRHYHDLSVEAMHAWRRMADNLGNPDWYQRTGGLTWAESDEHRAALADRIDRLRQWDYPVEDLTISQATRLEPVLRIPDRAQVAYFPSEAFVYGHHAVTALLTRAQQNGTKLVSAQADATLETDGAYVTAVRLGDGTRLHADVYVCCAGWRTPRLLEPLGVRVPLIPGEAPRSAAPCLVTRATGPTMVSRVIHAPSLTMRPGYAGGLHLEADDLNHAVDAHTPQHHVDQYGDQLVRRAGQLLPGHPVRTSTSHICIRPLPADGHPIIGWLPRLANTYLAVTHSGITLAPLLAQLATQDIAHRISEPRLAPYRPTRFPHTQPR